MKPHEQVVFRFGEFVLVPGERLLLRDGKSLACSKACAPAGASPVFIGKLGMLK